MIPESAIIRNLKDLKADKFYLLVYIKLKSDQDFEKEHQVSDISGDSIWVIQLLKHQAGTSTNQAK